MSEFKLHSAYQPTGDQPQAIKKLLAGLADGYPQQTLLGVTGSGKTYTMAQIIAAAQRPTLVMAPNKTLAGQLYSEFKQFFPENAVEYFISYYDYYQPEAYVPQTDTYIEKDSSINDEIDKLRHSATAALLERRDVIIVASVSCIYGLGAPQDYYAMAVSLRDSTEISRDQLLKRLVENHYERNEVAFTRGTLRVRGDVVEIFPPSHFVTTRDNMLAAASSIEEELAGQLERFKNEGKLLEAQRIEQRIRYDLEMIREIGYCKELKTIHAILRDEPPVNRHIP